MPPPIEVTVLEAYRDERGNEIRFSGRIDQGVKVIFRGSGNVLELGDKPHLKSLTVNFDCDNGLLSIGSSGARLVAALSAGIRIGQDCSVRLGRNVSSTGAVTITAAEGASVDVGNDVMFSSRNEIRADDAHPIFDVRTGKRVNESRSIVIGDHVWFAGGSSVLGGSTIGSGSVMGFNALVIGTIPNNVIAAGTPAKVVRRDIAWERPHLSLTKPGYKPDVSTVTKHPRYWKLTKDDRPAPAAAQTPAAPVITHISAKQRARALAGRIVRRLRKR